MLRMVGLGGSLRRGSYNRALLEEARGLMPPGWEYEILDYRPFPLYDADLEEVQGVPPAVAAGKDLLAAAAALLLVTPEYNNSIPGVLKNAIDWMSRPGADAARVYRDLPVALGGASPGGFGTNLSQVAWLPVLRALGLRLYAEKTFFASRAHTLFGPDGRLADEPTRARLKELVEGLAEFAVRNPRRR